MKFSIFQLVSVAEETGLKLALLETPKTGFVATRPIIFFYTDHFVIAYSVDPGKMYGSSLSPRVSMTESLVYYGLANDSNLVL